MRIRHAGGNDFVADPTVATVYNRGQLYERLPVSGEGDRCDWFAVPRDLATETVVANGLDPAPAGPFSFPFVLVPDQTYMAQRRLFRKAQLIGVSAFRLCRAFRKSTGSTIHKYLLTVRLRASLERLERSEADLSAVAYDLGFSGHSHFSVTFRRAFGETSSACRSVVALGPARPKSS